MSWRQFTDDYLTFTRKERIAVFVLLLLIVLVFILPAFYKSRAGSNSFPAADTAWMAAVKRMEVQQTEEPSVSKKADDNQWQHNRSLDYYKSRERAQLFYFDPNTLSIGGWEKLGLRDKTIKTIQNYLSKGGHFYNPADLSKVYGLFEDEYERLKPYIRIEPKQTKSGSFQSEKTFSPVIKKEGYRTIDINTADTTAWIALPGIGSRLALRITNFRDKLGGFYSISQVGETFGLQDSVFQKIKQYLKLEDNSVRKININTATLEELKAHPYIRYNIANAIIAYRNEHGLFNKIEDLNKLMVMTEDVFIKISGYLTIGD